MVAIFRTWAKYQHDLLIFINRQPGAVLSSAVIDGGMFYAYVNCSKRVAKRIDAAYTGPGGLESDNG